MTSDVVSAQFTRTLNPMLEEDYNIRQSFAQMIDGDYNQTVYVI